MTGIETGGWQDQQLGSWGKLVSESFSIISVFSILGFPFLWLGLNHGMLNFYFWMRW
jgi:hypothetical protein